MSLIFPSLLSAKMSIAGSDSLGWMQNHPLNVERQRIEDEAGDAYVAAIEAFARTVPTTTAGAMAMLSFIGDRAGAGDEIGAKFETIEDTVEHIVMESVTAFLRSQLS
jgi:hypothetical protein